MKRVVVIVVLIAVMTSLFTFYTSAITVDNYDINTYVVVNHEAAPSGSNIPINYYLITVQLVNNTAKWLIADTSYLTIRVTNSSQGSLISKTDINNLYNCVVISRDSGDGSGVSTYDEFLVIPNNNLVLAPNEVYNMTFTYTKGVTPGSGNSTSISSVDNPSSSVYDLEELVTLPNNQLAYLTQINNSLRDLVDAYNGVSGSSSISSSSSSINNQSNQVHSAESSYFAQNSQALANSGISNPNFEANDRSSINNGMGSVRSLFNDLWSNIGALRNIYIYALMMCLATYLLRHRPWISTSKSRREK